jgi:hypothetical protein
MTEGQQLGMAGGTTWLQVWTAGLSLNYLRIVHRFRRKPSQGSRNYRNAFFVVARGLHLLPDEFDSQCQNSLVERGFLTTDLPQNGPNRRKNQVRRSP